MFPRPFSLIYSQQEYQSLLYDQCYPMRTESLTNEAMAIGKQQLNLNIQWPSWSLRNWQETKTHPGLYANYVA